MAQVKQPQDRQPKDEKPKVVETDAGWTVTHRGVVLEIPREALNDFELLDDLAEVQKDPKTGSPRVPSILRRLAGQDGFRAVTTALRDPETGRVPVQPALDFVGEVFVALNPNG